MIIRILAAAFVVGILIMLADHSKIAAIAVGVTIAITTGIFFLMVRRVRRERPGYWSDRKASYIADLNGGSSSSKKADG